MERSILGTDLQFVPLVGACAALAEASDEALSFMFPTVISFPAFAGVRFMAIIVHCEVLPIFRGMSR